MVQRPKHIAIIMDGNGRWASQRNLPRIAGHRAGAKVVRPIVEFCGQQGVEVLSLFAFSLENRGRPQPEVQFLMRLMLRFLQRDTVSLHENNVRLKIIGDRRHLNEALQRQVIASEELTKENTGLTLLVALNYSGRWDIVQAAQQLLQTPPTYSTGQDIERIESELSARLSTANVADPDLLIRTSGEKRISNFFLWQLAYTEFYFSELYWPDFNVAELENALTFYRHRQRRFGLTPAQTDEHVKT